VRNKVDNAERERERGRERRDFGVREAEGCDFYFCWNGKWGRKKRGGEKSEMTHCSLLPHFLVSLA